MAQTTPKRPAAKVPTTSERATTSRRPATVIDRTKDVSEELLESVEKGQRAAIEAVRRFVDTVDHTLPAFPHGEGPSRRQEIVDSALEMADRLVHTQYDFLHKVIDSAGRSLSGPDGEKSNGKE